MIARREVTARDYFDMPETNERYELFEGKLLMAPMPSPLHQRISLALARALDDFARSHGGEVLLPVDVELAYKTVFQPDLAYISAERASIIGSHVIGAPDVAIEILSPRTRKFDREKKLPTYAVYGVREIWLVDPRTKTVQVYEASDGKPGATVTVDFGDVIPSAIVEVGTGGLEQFA